jgi:hypothetical protein
MLEILDVDKGKIKSSRHGPCAVTNTADGTETVPATNEKTAAHWTAVSLYFESLN